MTQRQCGVYFCRDCTCWRSQSDEHGGRMIFKMQGHELNLCLNAFSDHFMHLLPADHAACNSSHIAMQAYRRWERYESGDEFVDNE